MQQQQAHPHTPHWSPLPPSWIVAIAITVLAVLPHQIPVVFRRLVRSVVGGGLCIALAIWLVKRGANALGVALLLLVAAVWLFNREEGFSGGGEGFRAVAPIITKDRVKPTTRKWLGEELLSEDPIGIQERTESPQINYDEVTDDEARPWFAEVSLEESPVAIQNRPVGIDYEEGRG